MGRPEAVQPLNLSGPCTSDRVEEDDFGAGGNGGPPGCSMSHRRRTKASSVPSMRKIRYRVCQEKRASSTVASAPGKKKAWQYLQVMWPTGRKAILLDMHTGDIGVRFFESVVR